MGQDDAPKTWEEMIARYEGLVISTANGFRIRDPGTHEDLKAVGLATIWRAVKHFDPGRGAKLSTFLRKCCARAMKEHLERLEPMVAIPKHVALEEILDSSPGPEEVAEREDDLARMRQALAELPRDQRELIERIYGLDGMPVESRKKIERKLHIRNGCLDPLEAAALAALRAKMRPDDD